MSLLFQLHNPFTYLLPFIPNQSVSGPSQRTPNSATYYWSLLYIMQRVVVLCCVVLLVFFFSPPGTSQSLESHLLPSEKGLQTMQTKTLKVYFPHLSHMLLYLVILIYSYFWIILYLLYLRHIILFSGLSYVIMGPRFSIIPNFKASSLQLNQVTLVCL